MQTNLSIDNVKMYELDKSNYQDPNILRDARRNDREIRSLIPKLIKVLMNNKDKRDKFEKEFAS
jgi:hypothetical protein